MYKLELALILFLPALAPALHAQPSASPQPIVTVPESSCVVHSGDNSAWAADDFDTAGWQPLAQFIPTGKDSTFWVRCAADQSLATLPDPAVQVMNVYAGTVWVNGRKVGTIEFGPGSATWKSADALTLALPADVAGSVRSVAIRCVLSQVGWAHGYRPALIRLGIRESLIDHRIAEEHHFPDGLLPAYTLFLLVGASGIFLLGLYFYDRTQTPALWLALFCLPQGYFRVISYLYALAFSAPEPALMLWSTFDAFSDWFAVLFFFSIAQRRMPRVYWIVFASICYFVIGTNLPLALPPRWALPVSVFMFKSLAFTQAGESFAFTAPLVAFWPLSRLRGQRRTLFIVCLLWSMTEFFFFYQGKLFHLAWTSPVQNFVALACLLVIAALVAIIFRNQRTVALERSRLSTEIEAAREVQNRLVPAALPALPGFRLDAVFHPAAEVGGDFYQIFPQPGGFALIVIGDVSGKGLKAAMTGSMVVGALRSLAQENLSPAQILSRLNSQLAASSDSGFVTCLCARIAADGTLTMANAGHLSPYRDGKEVPLESGLPLGITADAYYTECACQFAIGDRLTFMSDGVVEARNAAGELFGFERTAAISGNTADQIAKAAEHFGQEDDITVLTVTFAPAEVLRA
jgi:hypothetical protein